MGICLSALGKKDEAAKCYTRTIEANPFDSDYYKSLISALDSDKKRKEALNFLKKILMENPSCKPAINAINEIKGLSNQ